MVILVLFAKFIFHIFMELFQDLSQSQNPSAQSSSFVDAHRGRVVHRDINVVHVIHRDYFFPNSFIFCAFVELV
jgi:hypothetical protein